MKKNLSILIYVNTNIDFSKKNLGCIETLNKNLYNFLLNKRFNVYLDKN